MYSKKDLRQLIRQRNKQLSEQLKRQQSVAILTQLAQHPLFLSAQTILLFHSLPDEVCTHTFIQQWSLKKQILLPVVKGNDLELRPYTNSAAMQNGAYGINEPTGTAFTKLESIDLIIVPGMAFDAEGHRLGRGKGYYDRLLSQPPLRSTYKIGICLPHQLVNHVTTEAHDVLMNEVLTQSSHT